ncbi:MAG TPA: ComEC/Rec2 family competence protein [Candidatus Paceibacterota bacterium]|nr:ComEC/Rec2 family competence protein [Candidatus Paceibacterota bacterium]
MGLLVALTGGFSSGVALRSIFIFGWPPIVFALFLALLFAGMRALMPRRAYAIGAVFCLALALGMLRAAIADTPLPAAFADDLRHRVSYDGVVIADPDMRDASQRVTLRVAAHGTTAKMLAVIPRTVALAVGDQVRVSGTLLLPQPFASDDGRTFRYEKYLQVDGVRYLLEYASARIEAAAPWYAPAAMFARVKHAFLDGLNAALPEPYASLAGGIIIGGKSGLGTQLQGAFVRSGLVQVIVLSGYNVMVVAEWVMAALGFMRVSRKASAGAGAVALILFVLIAGTSATAVRAALMALIALYARATGRTYAAGRALLAVVVLMLLWNPLYLAFSPGFGLSVAATAGLIWLAPLIEKRIASAFWRNAVATTLAAQLAVLPLLLYDTGNLSLAALPANLLVMPLVPLAMGSAALAGFAGMLFGHVAPLAAVALGFPAYLATGYLILIARVAASLPAATFVIPAFPFAWVIDAYALLAFISIRTYKKPAIALAIAGPRS